MPVRFTNILIAASAAIAITAQMTDRFGLFVIFKPLTTIITISLVLPNGRLPGQTFTRTVLFALLACLVGDIFLLWEEFFIYGLSAFLIGHLLFTCAFVQLGGFGKRGLPLVGLLVVASAYYSILAPLLGELKIPVAVYNLVIVIMAWQAACLALNKPNKLTRALFLASLLFMFSDAMIAFNKFVWPFELSSLVILLTYWLSIALIANAAAQQERAI